MEKQRCIKVETQLKSAEGLRDRPYTSAESPVQLSSCDLRDINYTWHGQIGLGLFGESISFVKKANYSHILNTELPRVRMCSYVLLPVQVCSGTSQEALYSEDHGMNSLHFFLVPQLCHCSHQAAKDNTSNRVHKCSNKALLMVWTWGFSCITRYCASFYIFFKI